MLTRSLTTRFGFGAPLAAAALLALAGAASAVVPTDWTYRVISRSGASPIAIPAGATTLSFGDPALNDQGDVVLHYALGSGDGVVRYRASDNSTLTLATSATTMDTDFTGSFDVRGSLVAAQRFDGTTQIYDLAGPLQRTFTLGGPAGVTGSVTRVRFADTGEIGYRAATGAGTSFILDNIPPLVPSRTQFVYQATGATASFLYAPTINGSRQLAARVDVPGGTEVRLYNAPGIGGFTTILSTVANGTFNAISPLTDLSDTGVVAYLARRSAGSIYELRTSDNRIIAVAGQGGTVTTNFINFAPSISESGLVVFRAQDAVGQAIFAGDGVTLSRVTGAGSTITTNLGPVTLTSSSGSTFGGNVRVNSQNQIVFNARLITGEDVVLLATPQSAAGNRCSAADIADDQGNPLLPGGMTPNNGVNEGDYNAFFNNFFTNQAAGSPADIANDNGNPLPPFGPAGGVNNGVNEGDYNAFFNTFFNGCP
ncbi:hypothetical protein BH11PLA1_BH11PLA1_13730 [soil metagenome]